MTSYSNANFSIITTDNYDKDDDPQAIVNMLSIEFPTENELLKVEEFDGTQKYHKEINRQKSFELAIDIARKYEEMSEDETKILIVTTGIGSEQLMIQPEGEVERDERVELRKTWTKALEI